ncbi:hypothetical protein CDL15_Pgr021051 [Punica granatum]|uniref:Uncharacterized protein n=1 Tax=Punica granatum TaxID=22663 RepID=A0A218XGM0_PUNGR|nr:hypothetical protein CDL15_Pgr021051 [Punica granatum]
MTNDTSGRVPGASRVSRDTPDLSWTPFLTGPQGPDPLTSKRHPKRAYSHPGTTGSWNKLQTTFRNSTRFPEGRFSGSKRLPVNLRGTSTKIEITAIPERLKTFGEH